MFPEVKDLLARQGLHLSGGQRKMVAVARAMMLSPRLLLLDEAFEGLAPVVVNRFTEAVHEDQGAGRVDPDGGIASGAPPRASATGSTPSTAARSSSRARPKDALADEKVVRALRG